MKALSGYRIESRCEWNDEGEQETVYDVRDAETGEYIYTGTDYATASRYSEAI